MHRGLGVGLSRLLDLAELLDQVLELRSPAQGVEIGVPEGSLPPPVPLLPRCLEDAKGLVRISYSAVEASNPEGGAGPLVREKSGGIFRCGQGFVVLPRPVVDKARARAANVLSRAPSRCGGRAYRAKSRANSPFWAWRRFSAWSKIAELGVRAAS